MNELIKTSSAKSQVYDVKVCCSNFRKCWKNILKRSCMLWLHFVEIQHCKERSKKSCVCHDCRNFKLCRTHFPKKSCMSWLSRPRFLSAGQLTQVCADLSESECYSTNAPCSRATCYMLYATCYLLHATCCRL